MTKKRIRMALNLQCISIIKNPNYLIERINPDFLNFVEVGTALYDAYESTIDGECVTQQIAIDEIPIVLNGEYGDFIPEASFLLRHENKVVSGILVSLFEGLPLITYVFTTKEYQNKGLATYLIFETSRALRSKGWKELILYVHPQNPALYLYKKIGFLETNDNHKD